MGRLIAAALALAVLALPAPAAARTITFSGAPSAGAVVADLAYFYRHQVRRPPRFSIVGGNTGSGIADVARGIVDAGLANRTLNAQDPPGLVVTPFALTGICLVTNVANPVPNFTRAELQGLVSGSVTSWSQVPGSPRTDAITPVGLDASAGAAVVFLATFVDLATTVGYQPADVRRVTGRARLHRGHAVRLGLRRPRVGPRAARRALRGRALHEAGDLLRRLPRAHPARLRHARAPARRARAVRAMGHTQPRPRAA